MQKGCRFALLLTGVLLLLCFSGIDIHAEAENGDAAAFGETAEIGQLAAEKEEWEKQYAFVHEEAFQKDYCLKGLFDSCVSYFHVGNWKVHKAALIMEFSASQLLEEDVSYYTVYLNGEPLITEHLSRTQGKTGQIILELPEDRLLTDSVNSIMVDVYLRGRDTDACVDDSSVSSWMNIFRESRIMIGYEPFTECSTISSFYRKFTSVEALENRQSIVEAVEEADETELTAMAYILSGISKNAQLLYQNIGCGLRKSGPSESFPYTVLVSKYENLSPDIVGKMSGEQRGYAEENAVICLVQEVENKYLLLVTGTEEAALVNAGIAFGNTDYMLLLDTDTVRVAKEDDFLVKPPVQGPYYFLTEYKTTVKGLFRQSAQFTVEFPAGKKLAESCELSLDFRYSSNLDFDKSLVSVCINDVPIGSRMLTREGADNTTEVFTIPPDIEIYGDFQVEIIFDFQAGDEWCRLTPEDTPWAVILDTSMLKLTAVDNMSLSFENFPAPFVRDGSMNNLQIIMPDENKDEDMQVMAGLLLTMGRYLKDNRGSLAVKKVEDAYSAEANRIVIGKLGGENLRDELNLPVSVNSGMAFLRRSAYGEESEAVLTITGEGAGMLHTLNYFGNTERLWEIKGDTFLTDGESLYCYRMTPETDEPAAPEAASESVSQKGPMLLIAISISCLVLLASVMLLIKYGRRESDEK